jgi:spermidine synthase
VPTDPDNRSSPGGGPLLVVLAFAGGLTSLGVEIAASRLLAPFFGTSTYIWGALIGLVLLYLTLGYYIGGWAADRWPRADYLYRLSAIAAALVLVIPLLSRPVLLFSQQALNGLAVGAFVGALLAVILLFAPAVILLGMVSPWVIRLRVGAVDNAGRAAGGVYAISTAGSILGAFLPAFWWIPSFGTRATIYGLGLLLLVVSAAGMVALRLGGVRAVTLLCALPLLGAAIPYGAIRPPTDGRAIYEADSEYGYIEVVERGSERDLILNEGQAIHSVYDPRRVLSGGYWDYFALTPMFGYRHWQGQRPQHVLVIGLAGGTVARVLTAAYGPVPIDGVEIDPRIIAVGQRYFAMTEPNLNAVAADGRYYLTTARRDYDLIVVDAYRQPYIPFQLTTKEFFEEARRHLGANGVVAVNVGRAPGDYRLVDAITGTLGDAFPEVYRQDTAGQLNTLVYAPNQPVQPAEVAANLGRDRAAYPSLVADIVEEARVHGPVHDEPHLPIYTDDLAPVERLVDSIIYRYATSSGR